MRTWSSPSRASASAADGGADALALAGLEAIGVRVPATSRVACRIVSASTRASQQLALLDVVLGVIERLLEHALDLLVGEPVGRLHLDRVLAPGAQVASP